MSAAILEQLRHAGVEVFLMPDGQNVAFRSHARLDEKQRAWLNQHKAELRSVLLACEQAATVESLPAKILRMLESVKPGVLTLFEITRRAGAVDMATCWRCLENLEDSGAVTSVCEPEAGVAGWRYGSLP